MPTTYQEAQTADQILATEDGVSFVVPRDEANADYQEYLAWEAIPGNDIAPADPPPIRYAASLGVDTQVQTTDATPHEVFRFPTELKHVYRATFQLMAIDAGNGAVKDAEARMTFKRGGATVVQVGTTRVLDTAQDAPATGWAIGAQGQAVDVVVTVTGAAGRVIDWQLFGQIAIYSPDGLQTT